MKQGITGCYLVTLTCGRRTYRSLTVPHRTAIIFCNATSQPCEGGEGTATISFFPEILFESFCKDLLQGGGDLAVRLNIGVGIRISSAL